MNRYKNVGFNPVDSRLGTFDPQRGFKIEPFEETDKISIDTSLKGECMYESPINIYENLDKKMTELKDNYIYAQVCEQLGVSVNKEHLMRALHFDRYQYDKGYRDALQENEWIPVERRLPDTEINPLTNDYNGYLCTARFGDDYDLRFYKFGNGHFWNNGQIMDEYVVAWKPRPDLYEQ